jgi:uncharacterized protein
MEVAARECARPLRAFLGVVDGAKPQGVEDQAGITWRKQFLRQIGYKLS